MTYQVNFYQVKKDETTLRKIMLWFKGWDKGLGSYFMALHPTAKLLPETEYYREIII